MNTVHQQPPLMGFHWNQAEADDLFNRGLLTIVAHDLLGIPSVIGTGFVMSSDDTTAVCITAAHVFEEVRRLQSPPPRHSPSTLAEFLPPKKSITVDWNSIQVVFSEGGEMCVAAIEGLVFDETTDFAVFSVAIRFSDSDTFFRHEFLLDDRVPEIGGLVSIFSYGEQGIVEYDRPDDQRFSVKFQRRPIVRVGRVLAYHPNGHRLCRGPCIETSIPVYSGMSGGPVAHYDSQGPIRVFGLVCSDPDLDSDDKQNRSIEGRSIIALLPCKVTVKEDGKQMASLSIQSADVAGNFASSRSKS